MNDSNSGTLLFLSRSDIWPSQIHSAYPNARFVARARTDARAVEIAEPFRSHVGPDIWGLLIDVGNPSDTATSRKVFTDDGRSLEVKIADGAMLDGNPADVLAAARYWELPPAFIDQMKAALADAGTPVEDEEPRDDGALG